MPNLFSSIISKSDQEVQNQKESSKLRIIIFGPPCSGKGTQCQLLQNKYDLIHISSGDLLREACKSNSKYSNDLNKYIQNGQLVPDQIMIDIINERILQEDCNSKGWLLDGFPRTFEQAKALQNSNIYPTNFFLLEVPSDLLIQRSINRRLDPETGKIYNLKTTLPETEAILNRLVKRHDDSEEVMQKRIDKYLEQVQPLKAYYDKILISLDGSIDSKTIFKYICSILDNTLDIIKS